MFGGDGAGAVRVSALPCCGLGVSGMVGVGSAKALPCHGVCGCHRVLLAMGKEKSLLVMFTNNRLGSPYFVL